MNQEEFYYYPPRITDKERGEYLALCELYNEKKIGGLFFNILHDEFWQRVKTRVDKEEGKIND